DWRTSLRWHQMYPHSGGATGEALEFRCEGWETGLLAWPAYKKSVRQRFEEKLLEYEIKTRKLAESQGLVRARRKYQPKHFEWFVLYQFKGLSSTEIAGLSPRRDSVDESTVLKGVKAAS